MATDIIIINEHLLGTYQARLTFHILFYLIVTKPSEEATLFLHRDTMRKQGHKRHKYNSQDYTASD